MELWDLVKDTAEAWNKHEAQRMGAALAFYTVLSMAPLVVISIAIAGFAFGEEAAQGQLVYQMRDNVGEAGAEVIQSVLQNAHRPSSGAIATVLGILTLLVGASGVFNELRSSLDRIWDCTRADSVFSIKATYLFYMSSFGMVLTIGFLLLVSLVVSTFLAVFEQWFSSKMPLLPVATQLFNAIFSILVISTLFALIYKFVPSGVVLWRDVRLGAFATAILFTLGKFVLAIYIAKMGVGSAYGAAGSFVAMLVWIYYSAQIFFFGAEFTHIYALRQHGVRTPAAA